MGLRILFTNNTLANRAGTEVYVRDVTLALKKRGHEPAAFSLALGEVAAELRDAGVEVVDDLRQLAHPPDIIHGQHHVETCIAATRFPGVPVVYFCHGAVPWEEIPPVLPTLRHYVAVDDAVYESLTEKHKIPASRITRIYNFADLDRFQPRPPLPQRPGKALVFSNLASSRTHLPAIEKACVELGIDVDVAGCASGRRLTNPEKMLGNYDIVFAKARAAIEAMVTGCAVILCDANGAGPLVTPENVATLRPLNFGFRAFTAPLTPAHLKSQIDLYRPENAVAVRDWMRAHASMSAAIDRIEEIYALALREHSAAPAVQAPEMVAAIADYLPLPGAKIKGLVRAAALPPDTGPGASAPPVIELFADRGKGYNATDSSTQRIDPGAIRTILFYNIERLCAGGSFPLRIDPASMPAIIRIYSIRIFRHSDGTVLYSANTAEDFEAMTFSEELLRDYHDDALEIISRGTDPQIYLPLFGDPGSDPCTLAIVLLVEPASDKLLTILTQGLQERERLSGEIHALRTEVKALHAANGQLEGFVQSAEEWQRSWFRRAFHRWHRSPRKP